MKIFKHVFFTKKKFTYMAKGEEQCNCYCCDICTNKMHWKSLMNACLVDGHIHIDFIWIIRGPTEAVRGAAVLASTPEKKLAWRCFSIGNNNFPFPSYLPTTGIPGVGIMCVVYAIMDTKTKYFHFFSVNVSFDVFCLFSKLCNINLHIII